MTHALLLDYSLALRGIAKVDPSNATTRLPIPVVTGSTKSGLYVVEYSGAEYLAEHDADTGMHVHCRVTGWVPVHDANGNEIDATPTCAWPHGLSLPEVDYLDNWLDDWMECERAKDAED